MRVLVGCEFGGGRGHAVFAASVTRILRELNPACQIEVHASRGHALTAMDRDHDDWRQITDFVPRSAIRSKARPTFGLMLFDALCGDAESWDARLRYWDEAFTGFKPDIVLAEYSPGLSMFARGRVPTVVTGTGYSIPPPDLHSFPPYGATEADAVSEADCVETLNRGLAKVGAKALQFLPQMNAGDLVGLVTLPLFDPYWEVRKELYLGAEIPSGAPKPGPETSRILAYFSDAVLPDSTWAELGAINRQIEVYGSGARPKNLPANLVMRDRPFDLARDLPGADLAIHCGGLGFSSSAVLAGVRQLVLYEHDEHWGQARGVTLARVGTGLPLLSLQPGQVREAAEQLLGDQQCKGFALALAKQYAPFAEARPSERVAKEILLRG